MSLMLASVRNRAEAEQVLAAGAEMLDLEDPMQAGLDAAQIRDIVAAVNGRASLCALAGDLSMRPDRVTAAAQALAQSGLDTIRVGLHPGARRLDCIRALAGMAARVRLIGVLFADDGADMHLIDDMNACGFAGAMLDIRHKERRRLLDYMNTAELQRFVDTAQRQGLLCGLAGALEAPDVPRLLPLRPDFLGFRGALRHGHDRNNAIDGDALALIRGLIPLARDETPSVLDYGRMRARSYARDANPEDAAADRILVRDLVLPVFIGAYQREHGRPQCVRFNVVAQVRRATRAEDDMRNVFSYDLIIDAINRLVAAGHVGLVETLAERIADDILQHASVLTVDVRVEKLDIGPGAVGIEIRRARAAAAATVLELFPAYLEKGPQASS